MSVIITFLIKAGGVVRAAQATDGLIRSAGTTTTYHQLICGGDPSCEVIRGWCYGPCRLRVNGQRRHSTYYAEVPPRNCSLICLLIFAMVQN